MRFTSFKMIKRAFTITVFISASFLNSYAQLDDTSKGKTAVTASDYIGTYGSDEYFCAGGPCRDVCVFEIDKTPNKYYCRWYVNGDLLETDQATLFADPKFTYDININGSYKVIEAKIYTSAWVYLEVHKWYVNLVDVNLNLVGKTSVCQGDVETYSVTPPYGITQFLWEIPAGWSGTSNSETISLVIGSSPGDILCRTVIPNNPNCWVGDGLTVSVNNLPAQPGTITGSTSVCQGSSQTYSIGAVSGATSYTWTLPSGWSGNSSSRSITTIPGSNGGTISVTANNSCGSSSPRTLSVSVTAIPAQPGTITGSTSVCQGSSQTYSIEAVSGATSYTWTLPSGWSGNSSSRSITTIPGSNGGTISVTANNSCGASTPRTLNVSVISIPSQPGSISGETNVTPGQSYTYSIGAVSGATSYSWTIPSGWSGSSTTTSITIVADAHGGDISVTANNNCGSSSPRTLVVSTCDPPAQPGSITGSTSVCQGSSQTYSIEAVSGATSYTWTLPSGWSGSSTTTSITTTAGASGGTISVTANSSCGASTPRTLSVSVISIPSQPGSISGETNVTPGQSYTYSIGAVSGATSYSWTIPSGWSGSSTTTSITVVANAHGGDVSVTANNNCGSSSPRTLAVSTCEPPAQPGSITGSTSVCQGSSQTYSIEAVSGATSYTWTLPSGWSGSSTTTSITATAGASGGTISVTANSSCGTSTSRTLSVSVTTIPSQPGAISGETNVTIGQSYTYSIGAVSGATSYSWTIPSGWSGSSTTTFITVVANAHGGDVSVTANNNCGSSSPRTLAVSTCEPPAQPGSITGSTSVCQGSSQTYSIEAVSGATSYTWTLPSGWSGSSTTTSITATAGASGGTISVTANSSCGASTPRTLSVSVISIPSQPGSISGETNVTPGQSYTYSIGAVSGATSYSWTIPSGWSGSSTTTSITVVANAHGGDVSVTANNNCGSSSPRTLAVSTCEPPAQPGSITGSTSVCQGSSQTYSIEAVSGATSYTWTLPSGWSGSSTTTSITATAGASGGTISVTANSSCGTSTSRTLSVSVTTIPSQPGAISGETNVTIGQSYTYSIGAVSGATSYSWTIPYGWSGGTSTTNSITVTAGANGGDISVTANNNCGSSTPRMLTVASACNPPAQPGTISGEINVTPGQSYNYRIETVSRATSYSWTIPSGWSGSSTTNSITVTAGANGGDISVIANNNCGSSTPRMLTVASACNPPAQPGTISGEINVTPGQSYNYRIETVLGATSYSWTIPSGWSGSSTTNSITVTAGANGGDISVIANNNCGSSSPSILNVNLIIDCTVPEITIKWDDVLICSNIDNIFLSYQWFNGTIPIPGANEQYYVTSKQPGIYKVETIDRNGCREMSNEITVTGSKSLTVYPNPAKSSFTVSIIDQPVGKVNLRIINSTGMKIMDIETEKADIEFLKEIPADDLEEGFYIVQVIIDQTYLYNSKILVIK